MDVPDHYQSVAEVAITIVGFSGIISLFSDRLNIAEDRVNRMRFTDLLLAGFGAVLFSYLPTALSGFIDDDRLGWRTACILLASWYLFSLGLLGYLGRGGKLKTILRVILPITGLLLAVLLLLTGLDLLVIEPVALYFVALLWLLGMSAQQFCSLIYKSLRGT